MKVLTSKNKLSYRLRRINLKGRIFFLIILGVALFTISRYFLFGGSNFSPFFASNQFVNDKSNFCYKLQNTQVLYLTPTTKHFSLPNSHCAKEIYCQNLDTQKYDKETDQIGPPNLWLYNLCTKDKKRVSNNNDREGITDLLTWSPSKQYALIKTKSDFALLNLSTRNWTELGLGGYELDSYQWLGDSKIKISYILTKDRYASDSRTKYEETIDPKTMKRQKTSYTDIPGHNTGGGKWLGLVDKFSNWELYQKEETITENQLYKRFYSLKNIQTQQELPVIEVQLGISDCADINYLGRDSKDDLYFLTCDKEKSKNIPELRFSDNTNKPAKALYKYDLTQNKLITLQDFSNSSSIDKGILIRTGYISHDSAIFLVGKQYNLVPDYNNPSLMVNRSNGEPTYLYKFDKETNEFSLFYKGDLQVYLTYPNAIREDGLIQGSKDNNIPFFNTNNNFTQTFDTKLGDYFSLEKVLVEGNNRKLPY